VNILLFLVMAMMYFSELARLVFVNNKIESISMKSKYYDFSIWKIFLRWDF
jgi:hypothetical protein